MLMLQLAISTESQTQIC